jgi:hypothetical protein
MRRVVQSNNLTAYSPHRKSLAFPCQLLFNRGPTFVYLLNQNGCVREGEGALHKEQQCFPRISRFMLSDIRLVFISYCVIAVRLSAQCASPLYCALQREVARMCRHITLGVLVPNITVVLCRCK